MNETTATISPKRNKKKLLITGLSALIVLAGAGGAAFWWSQRASAQTQTPPADAAAASHDSDDSGMVSFEPFVVNLADAGVSRFLRVKIQLIVGGAENAEAITKSPVKLSRARSAILELLTTQTSDVLVTPAGKAALRKAISDSLGHSLHAEIIDVLFSDFVVQF